MVAVRSPLSCQQQPEPCKLSGKHPWRQVTYSTLYAQTYSALLNSAVKCGEVELAVDVYRQMGQEGMERDKPVFQTMVDVFVKMGRPADALAVLDDVKKTGEPAEVQLYNIIVLSCTKMNSPRAALDVYKRCLCRPAWASPGESGTAVSCPPGAAGFPRT